MSFFASLFGPKLELPQDVELRLDKWQSTKNKSEQDALADTTFVIVDVETSGLNPKRDRLLAIGACVLRGNQLWAGAGFERRDCGCGQRILQSGADIRWDRAVVGL